MRIKMKYSTIIVLLLFMCGCEKEVNTYNGNDIIFFEVKPYGTITDSTYYTFAYEEEEIRDTLVNIHIQIAGQLKNYDRKVDIEIDCPDPEVRKGVQFDFNPDTCYIRTNSTGLDLSIRVKRFPEMTDKIYAFGIRLLENEYFLTTNKKQITDPINNLSVDLLYHRILFSDILERPVESWFEEDSYFGTFSRKKFLLICEQTGYKRKDFKNQAFMVTGRKNYIKTLMNDYFAQYKTDHAGDEMALDKIKEENGLYMEMGK